jgi:hypothetical protein
MLDADSLERSQTGIGFLLAVQRLFSPTRTRARCRWRGQKGIARCVT